MSTLLLTKVLYLSLGLGITVSVLHYLHGQYFSASKYFRTNCHRRYLTVCRLVILVSRARKDKAGPVRPYDNAINIVLYVVMP